MIAVLTYNINATKLLLSKVEHIGQVIPYDHVGFDEDCSRTGLILVNELQCFEAEFKVSDHNIAVLGEKELGEAEVDPGASSSDKRSLAMDGEGLWFVGGIRHNEFSRRNDNAAMHARYRSTKVKASQTDLDTFLASSASSASDVNLQR